VKLARYLGGGEVAIVEEDVPACPPGGLLVRTEASGLCSGELMDWYMDRKIPHVLGHEVAGIVVESQDDRFPVGCRVAPHHHAPCMTCDLCRRDAYVHCEQWKRTKLVPGGMAEFFAVSAENLTDTHVVWDGLPVSGGLRAIDAALIEPLGCVMKSIWRAPSTSLDNCAVIGLGTMGLLHALVLRNRVGIELSESRREWAHQLGIEAIPPEAVGAYDLIFVCPGTATAIDLALRTIEPDGAIVLFSPLGPPGRYQLDVDRAYFADVSLITSYSCGPRETAEAKAILEAGTVRAEQVVSDFIAIDELPRAYQAMKRGEILKPMVVFG